MNYIFQRNLFGQDDPCPHPPPIFFLLGFRQNSWPGRTGVMGARPPITPVATLLDALGISWTQQLDILNNSYTLYKVVCLKLKLLDMWPNDWLSTMHPLLWEAMQLRPGAWWYLYFIRYSGYIFQMWWTRTKPLIREIYAGFYLPKIVHIG